MEEYIEACGGQPMFILLFLISSTIMAALGLVLRTIISKLFKSSKNEISTSPEDVVEMFRTTMQISHDWKDMASFIASIHEEQTNFMNRLQTELDERSEAFCQKITVALEEEFLRNDQRFTKMKRIIEAMQEDFHTITNALQGIRRNPQTLMTMSNETVLIDNTSQTECEMKRRSGKNSISSEGETRLVTMVKKCLTDLMKDAKLHLSIDREEENRELQIIFSKLAEDREDVKKTIIQAFSLAAEQAKKNYDQFGEVGQEAMRYIAVLNENTNKMLKMKLEEADGRLKEIMNALNRQTFDVAAVRETLDNIDSQFDDIFQRVELSTQRNAEHFDDITQHLEDASIKWENTTVELGTMTKNFTEDIRKMKGLLLELKNLMHSVKRETGDATAEHNELLQYDSTASSSLQQNSLAFMYSMIKACWERMVSMNNNLGDGCQDVYQVVQMLLQKLQLLNESVDKLEGAISCVPTGGATCTKCLAINAREIQNAIKYGVDFESNMYQTLEDMTVNDATPISTSIDKEVRMIDLILSKVSEGSEDEQNTSTPAHPGSNTSNTVVFRNVDKETSTPNETPDETE